MIRSGRATVIWSLLLFFYLALCPEMPSRADLNYFCLLSLADGLCVLLSGQIEKRSRKKIEQKLLKGTDLIRNEHLSWSTSEIIDHDLRLMEQRIERKEQIIRSLSRSCELWVHEIKAPLNVLLLIGEESGRKDIIEQSEKIERCVTLLLKSGKLEADQDVSWTVFPLEKAVRQAVRNCSTLLIRHDFEIHLPHSQGRVCSDFQWTVFILEQLITNAVKYRNSSRQSCLSFVISQDTQNPYHLKLDVMDNGQGIAPEDLPRIFERGYTGLSFRDGSGISSGYGLYLARQAADLIQIRLKGQSRKNEGSVFTLRFDADDVFLFQKDRDRF